jgi:putative endonuclease
VITSVRKRTGPGGPPGLQNRSLPALRGGWVRLPGASAIRLASGRLRRPAPLAHGGRIARRAHVEWRPERAHGCRRVEGRPSAWTVWPAMPPIASSYFVYIASCSDGTLYVGSTSDVVERERVHNEGRGAKYTAGRRPVRVVYSEIHESRSAAQKREAQLKRWTRAKKQALVDADRRRLHSLARRRTGPTIPRKATVRTVV